MAHWRLVKFLQVLVAEGFHAADVVIVVIAGSGGQSFKTQGYGHRKELDERSCKQKKK